MTALAQRLLHASEDWLAAELAVEELLLELLPDWRVRFPRSLGWRWTPPAAIDIYEASDSAAAAAALHRAGFARVTIHQHGAARSSSCACAGRTR